MSDFVPSLPVGALPWVPTCSFGQVAAPILLDINARRCKLAAPLDVPNVHVSAMPVSALRAEVDAWRAQLDNQYGEDWWVEPERLSQLPAIYDPGSDRQKLTTYTKALCRAAMGVSWEMCSILDDGLLPGFAPGTGNDQPPSEDYASSLLGCMHLSVPTALDRQPRPVLFVVFANLWRAKQSSFVDRRLWFYACEYQPIQWPFPRNSFRGSDPLLATIDGRAAWSFDMGGYGWFSTRLFVWVDGPDAKGRLYLYGIVPRASWDVHRRWIDRDLTVGVGMPDAALCTWYLARPLPWVVLLPPGAPVYPDPAEVLSGSQPSSSSSSSTSDFVKSLLPRLVRWLRVYYSSDFEVHDEQTRPVYPVLFPNKAQELLDPIEHATATFRAAGRTADRTADRTKES